jgi:hypothetical protein
VAQAKKKKPARNLYTAADIKLLKQHSKARTPVPKIAAYEKIRRVVETEGSKTRNRSGPSTMIVNRTPEKRHHAAPAEIQRWP